jgi:glutamyl-tRNA synthetase
MTDVIRGDDHLSNTPKQLLVLEALGHQPPRYAHLPLLHGPDGKKLSKRHGAASVTELREAGYLPEAVRNYLALLGWGTQDDTTLMSTDELVDRFSIDRVGVSSAIFDEQKLRWMNGRFMRELPAEEYAERVAAHVGRKRDARFDRACSFAQEKAQTLGEVWPLIRFAFDGVAEDEKAWRKVMTSDAEQLLAMAREALEPVAWDREAIQGALEALLAETGVKPGKLFQPIRVALTGSTVSPGIFETLAMLDRDEAFSRLESAVSRLKADGQSAD